MLKYTITAKLLFSLCTALNKLSAISFLVSFFNTIKPLNSGHLLAWSKLSAIRRCPLFGGLVKIFFLLFALLYQDMQTFYDKKGQEIDYI